MAKQTKFEKLKTCIIFASIFTSVSMAYATLLAYAVTKVQSKANSHRASRKDDAAIEIDLGDVDECVDYQYNHIDDPIKSIGTSATGAIDTLIAMPEGPKSTAAENSEKEEITSLTTSDIPSYKMMMLDAYLAMDIHADSISKSNDGNFNFISFMRGKDKLVMGCNQHDDSYAWSVSTDDMDLSYHFENGKCLFRQSHNRKNGMSVVVWSDGHVVSGCRSVPKEEAQKYVNEAFNPHNCGKFSDVVDALNSCAERAEKEKTKTINMSPVQKSMMSKIDQFSM